MLSKTFFLVFKIESHYDCCPSPKDWEKTEKVCDVLEKFWTAVHIMFGSDYPMSNFFLREVEEIKKILDTPFNNEDDFFGP